VLRTYTQRFEADNTRNFVRYNTSAGLVVAVSTPPNLAVN
jgi:hypothetical protein